jgi:hypothetical protein
LISSSIIPKDEHSETICDAIIDTLRQMGDNLDRWIAVHENMFGQNHDIPPGSSIDIAKLEGGMITTDTCNGARLLSKLLAEEIDLAVKAKKEELGEAAGEDESFKSVVVQDCHGHMRNIFINGVTKRMSTYLSRVLAEDLQDIDRRLRVGTMFDTVLIAIDKEFSIPANYPKGHGPEFKHWLKAHHPGALLVPVQRTAGSRQDLATEGAAAVYWNRR